jgi:glycogen synthase kinase 3 beta
VSQVFRKASTDAIDLISRLLEYTPTQRLSAIEALCHPFFDELRDPSTKLPDSRGNGGVRDLPPLFDFSRHGTYCVLGQSLLRYLLTVIELSILPSMNERLVPQHARQALLAKGIDLNNFVALSRDEMMAKLD